MNELLLTVAQQGARKATNAPPTMQIILVAVFGAAFLFLAVTTLRGRIRTMTGVFWTLLALAALVASVWPELTTWFARQVLGVQAGINAVVYLTAIGMVIGFFMLYVRLQRLRNELTVLVRRLAIAEAKESGAGPDNGSS
jgi:hypothetical protein